jgi:hypothetical protein
LIVYEGEVLASNILAHPLLQVMPTTGQGRLALAESNIVSSSKIDRHIVTHIRSSIVRL